MILCILFAEHMLFMGSDEFPDENEVCWAMSYIAYLCLLEND